MLSLFLLALKIDTQMIQTAQQTIEVEFEKLLNALAVRKRALLSEIEVKFQVASMLKCITLLFKIN